MNEHLHPTENGNVPIAMFAEYLTCTCPREGKRIPCASTLSHDECGGCINCGNARRRRERCAMHGK